jgi:hypothetical protein
MVRYILTYLLRSGSTELDQAEARGEQKRAPWRTFSNEIGAPASGIEVANLRMP